MIRNGGAISTSEIRKEYGLDSRYVGLGNIAQRLRQLMIKKIIAKVKGNGKEVIYFIIDLSYFNKDKDKSQKYKHKDKLKYIEEEFIAGASIKEVADKYCISYRWAWELHKRFLKSGTLYHKKDGRPCKTI
jgi:hypothetical protein